LFCIYIERGGVNSFITLKLTAMAYLKFTAIALNQVLQPLEGPAGEDRELTMAVARLLTAKLII
jgi:hypothetical protein